MNKKTVIMMGIRISPEVKQALEESAHENMRSMNQEIEFILRKELNIQTQGRSPV